MTTFTTVDQALEFFGSPEDVATLGAQTRQPIVADLLDKTQSLNIPDKSFLPLQFGTPDCLDQFSQTQAGRNLQALTLELDAPGVQQALAKLAEEILSLHDMFNADAQSRQDLPKGTAHGALHAFEEVPFAAHYLRQEKIPYGMRILILFAALSHDLVGRDVEWQWYNKFGQGETVQEKRQDIRNRLEAVLQEKIGPDFKLGHEEEHGYLGGIFFLKLLEKPEYAAIPELFKQHLFLAIWDHSDARVDGYTPICWFLRWCDRTAGQGFHAGWRRRIAGAFDEMIVGDDEDITEIFKILNPADHAYDNYFPDFHTHQPSIAAWNTRWLKTLFPNGGKAGQELYNQSMAWNVAYELALQNGMRQGDPMAVTFKGKSYKFTTDAEKMFHREILRDRTNASDQEINDSLGGHWSAKKILNPEVWQKGQDLYKNFCLQREAFANRAEAIDIIIKGLTPKHTIISDRTYDRMVKVLSHPGNSDQVIFNFAGSIQIMLEAQKEFYAEFGGDLEQELAENKDLSLAEKIMYERSLQALKDSREPQRGYEPERKRPSLDADGQA